MKKIAHLFEDPETGMLWMNTYTMDETGYIKTANGILDFAKFRVVDAELVSFNNFGLCMASADLVTVKNKDNMYSVLAPYTDTMGYGAVYASICKGFRFKSAFGFGSGIGGGLGDDYVVAENGDGKWGLIKISRAGNIWYEYNQGSYAEPIEVVCFEYDSLLDVLRERNVMIPVSAMINSFEDKYFRDLTEPSYRGVEEIGTSLATILKEREYTKLTTDTEQARNEDVSDNTMMSPNYSQKGTSEIFPRKNGGWDYRTINYRVMTDTKKQYETLPQLQEDVRHSIEHQFMVAQEENIDQPVAMECCTQYVTSPRRTFEAAKEYKGKKVAVLNFANNHSIGGAPFSAGAQEESLCRCSTLYPCLQAVYEPFYKKHSDDFDSHRIDMMGNDDLIYTPDVVVFKTDERTDPVCPCMMNQNEWYKVDVITCAAPDLRHGVRKLDNYEEIITRRIKKILDVAAKEKVEVLILGAWGCGAFGNDIKVVANAFYTLLENYNFETVEFALGSTRFHEYFPKGTMLN